MRYQVCIDFKIEPADLYINIIFIKDYRKKMLLTFSTWICYVKALIPKIVA